MEIDPLDTSAVRLAKSSLAGGGAAAKADRARSGKRQRSLFIVEFVSYLDRKFLSYKVVTHARSSEIVP